MLICTRCSTSLGLSRMDLGQRVVSRSRAERLRVVAECGKAIARFREFVVFHSEYVYPEYVVAYQRFMGRSGPVA